MKDYSLLRNKIDSNLIDNLIKFVKSEKEVSPSSWQITQKTTSFLRNLNNFVVGEHKWHSYQEAHDVLKYYVYYATDDERDDIKTEKILKLMHRERRLV